MHPLRGRVRVKTEHPDHSIIEYHGKWYIFYHDCEMSDGINHRRCVKYTELMYNDDGTIVTIDPYK